MNKLEQKLDSREVAEMVGKAHDKLLRDIRTYIEQLSLSKIGESDFFVESKYKNERGKEYPCYLITKRGLRIYRPQTHRSQRDGVHSKIHQTVS